MQDTYLSALQSLGAASFKNSQSFSGGSSAAGMAAPGMAKKPPSPANMNTFQSFQKVPSSSLLLSNYDPFYSPLLSRLDSVFAQLKLNSENESCREKLICLMYANPAKYAPYSNLVSAQLSRWVFSTALKYATCSSLRVNYRIKLCDLSQTCHQFQRAEWASQAHFG